MRRILIYLTILIFPILIILTQTSFSITRGIRITDSKGQNLKIYRNYHAMVVGVSNYEIWPKLPNAINDAKEVALKLKELGFEVKLVLDPTAREMRTMMSDMVYEMGREEDSAILFYYAGHGETETLADKTKMGYLVPRDCPLMEKDPKGFASHAISMRDIESASLRIRSKHVLMLFDSCFSGSLFALVRAVPHNITEKSALPVRQYITAGSEDEQVPDRSMFKRCFLIGLDGDADLTGDEYITGSELGMYLSDKVVNYTHRQQHPQYGKINNPDLDRGDFIFVTKKAIDREAAKEKAHQEEKSVINGELKRLQEEREKTEELVRKLQQLLEAKLATEKKEKGDLEEAFKKVEEDKEIDKELRESKIKELETQRIAYEEKAKNEADEKIALEEELKRLKHEMKKTSPLTGEIQKKQTGDKRLAYIPQTSKRVYDKLRHGQGPFVIDDFEDKDLWSINFESKWIKAARGKSKIDISADPTQGANNTSCSMKIEYEISERSSVHTGIGGGLNYRLAEVEKDKSSAYDFSRFNKIVFYIKGKRKKTFFYRPKRVFVSFGCYGEEIKSNRGKCAFYTTETEINPEQEWKKIEIPLVDLVPTGKTAKFASNYPSKPNLKNGLVISFAFVNSPVQGNVADSNTVWIDEITLE